MSGSFTWDAIVRIGTIKPYEKALVLTVFHTLASQKSLPRSPERPAWNTIVCFKDSLRTDIVEHLTPGDLVHFQGYVRTSTFTDDADAKRRAVDLVIQRFDLLHKHIDGPTDLRADP
tara:strand:- start:536 stop:886 length:351 start_codon:yes stop_codon:yes gene_type:complete